MFFTRCLLLLLLPTLLRAQVSTPTQFRFEHLTVNDGLGHSDAMAVAQDSGGFIWVGTNGGLDRYDGYGLRHYALPPTPQGLPGGRIKILHKDRNGLLWVGADRAGLSYYDATLDRLVPLAQLVASPATAPLLRQLATKSVVALASDSQGHLWVATQNAGLFRLRLAKPGRLAELLMVRLPVGVVTPTFTSMTADSDGAIWIGTLGRGLYVVPPGQPYPVAEATAITQNVRVLQLDWRGDLWIGLDQQVLWVSSANRRAMRELDTHPQPLRYPLLQSLLLDSFGRLWVGTLYGLYVWEAGPVTQTAPPPAPLPYPAITPGGQLV